MSKIDELARNWLRLKSEEQRLYDERIEIESEIVKMVPTVPEGQKSSKMDGFKITVNNRVNRNIDLDIWEEIKGDIPEAFWPVRTKIVINESMCKKMSEEVPDLWFIASRAITEKPGKPTVSIEELD